MEDEIKTVKIEIEAEVEKYDWAALTQTIEQDIKETFPELENVKVKCQTIRE